MNNWLKWEDKWFNMDYIKHIAVLSRYEHNELVECEIVLHGDEIKSTGITFSSVEEAYEFIDEMMSRSRW